MTIDDATDYLNYAQKEGCFEWADIDPNSTDEELIELAEKMDSRAMYYYESQKEESEQL
ncbi:MAG: hypothetical protein NUV98_07325 [Candidatus Roizmanbacteria bacterium]|nr:hypothetical protein [Candidatus Roizmanbacteria bacterium]